jgi:hypothetical protein
VKIDVQHEWQAYRTACFGGQRLTRVQEVEMHRAFFAGMLANMNLMRFALSEPEATALLCLEELATQIIAELASLLAVQA